MDASRLRRARTAVECGTLVLFLAALCAPLADQIVRPSSERGPTSENRNARPMPPFPLTGSMLSKFPGAFEAHHADTFGLRDVLLRWNSRVKLGVFGVTPTPTLVIDDSGWVDYASENTLEIWRGAMPLSSPEVKSWMDYFQLCQEFCARTGAQYYYLSVPNKETIYPDHVPGRYTRFGPSRFEQLVAALPSDRQALFVDTRADLRAARAQDQAPWDYLYSMYGTHWNGRGTWLTYRALMRAFGSARDDVKALGDDEVRMIVEDHPTHDTWGPRMYLPDDFLHPVEHPEIVGARRWQQFESVSGPETRWSARNQSSKGPHVLVFHDSFGASLQDLFASTFPEVTFIHSWFDPAVVLARHPDIVLEERVERVLASLPILSPIGRQIMEANAPPPEGGDLVLAIDAQSPDSALATTGPAHVERTQDGIAFRSETSKGGWVLPAFTLPPERRVWLHVDLESEQRGMLIAYRKSNATGAWLRLDAAYVPYDPGHTQRTVELPGPPGSREIRLQVPEGPKGVLVRRLEVRTTGS